MKMASDLLSIFCRTTSAMTFFNKNHTQLNENLTLLPSLSLPSKQPLPEPPMSTTPPLISPQLLLQRKSKGNLHLRTPLRCQSSQSSSAAGDRHNVLQIGSPIILVEAPPTLKTATSMPSLRVNDGLVKPGDVGRIVSRKPKDVWAVRLAIGTYLIDGKHFKPLDLDE